ncbi:uroporphyrinogen-III C-methyltransferase [Sulfurimonas sp. HSL1-2]|uniref:uroporphyrinogen-III C-methyltransferase n=1 Tax=Thiomicrolovo zhangzhouensis TaxID=3131933 RepID=UPI0031F7A898
MMQRITLPVVLHNPKILLIGGGPVALQKAQVMRRNQIDFDVIAALCSEAMRSLVPEACERSVTEEDCREYGIIIDATGNAGVTAMLTALKQRQRFLLNVVDVPEQCDFFFAALIEQGPVKIAVSSSGGSPAIAQAIRDKIARMLPASLAALGQKAMRERLAGHIRPGALKAEANRQLGRVHLVGCGTGDVDLLTLKAYRLITEADVVFVDHLVSEEIKAIIPKATMVIHVGKRKGHHSIKQEKINELLIEYAQKGLEVARLKAGDPYIFGRGAEEAQALAAEGIRVEVVPGISSAVAGPLAAGIAPTARGYAANLSIVSAHLAGNRINTEWIDLLKLKNHTTIVLMGVSRAKEIVEKALEAGVAATMPCAVISNASRPDQQRFVTTLEGLPAVAENAPRPAIIVFGDVVNLHAVLPQYINEGEYHDQRIASGL